ncbi:MAG: ArnT family glycosyltransferase [Bacteroidales bacterium]
MDKNKHLPFQLISLAFLVVLVLPVLIQDGMFMDGQQYACVAKNLAEGKGSFWFPHLSDTWWKAGSPHFMEHPPLVYGMQSMFFKVFGNSLYTERIYSFFTLLIALMLIIRIWKFCFSKKSPHHHAWWVAVLFWIWIPLTSWSYQNNLMENSMLMFDLLAVFFLLKFLKGGKNYIMLALGSLAIFAAFLSKGLPGLFPLLIIPLHGIVFRDKSVGFYAIHSLLFLVLSSVWLLLIVQWQDAGESLGFYLKERLLTRISDDPTVKSQYFIIKQLLINLIPVLFTMILLLIVQKRLRISKLSRQQAKLSALFLLTGLSASLPLFLTPVQRGFYLMPSFPFFAISAAILVLPVIHHYVHKSIVNKSKTILLIIGIVFIASAFIYSGSRIGKTGRHELVLEDAHAIGGIVPENTIITAPEQLYDNWALQVYLVRHYNISMKVSNEETKWTLSDYVEGVGNPIICLESGPWVLYRTPE